MRARIGWLAPTLVAMGVAACGARSDLLYGDEQGAGGAPFLSGTAGSGTGGVSGAGSGGAPGVAGGTGVAGSGGMGEPPIAPDEQSGCVIGGGTTFEGDVTASVSEALRVLEGCSLLRGDLEISGTFDLSALRSLQRINGQLRLVGYSGQLMGLERLEEVWELWLDSVRGLSFAPLRSLTRLKLLNVVNSSLPNFSGLGSLTNLRRVEIENSEINTTLGLALPAETGLIRIDKSLLGDLLALAPVTKIQDLELHYNTGLTSLSGLEGLERARRISVFANDALANVDALSGLIQVRELFFVENQNIQQLPEFPRLESLGALRVAGNARLRNVPELPRVSQLGSLTIYQNPSLTQLRLPTLEALNSGQGGVDFFGDVDIEENASLARVSLPRLAGAQVVIVERNPALVSLDLAALTAAPGSLIVTLNQQLPPASLSNLANLTSQIHRLAGNQGEATSLDPCPWLNDTLCDESLGLCAMGTDAQDCFTF